MKEAFDREIDSLLRRRARGAAESRPWGDGSGDGPATAHLDADELGAFAEGALPAAARLAAASHLADCERCRGVVVGLARATGAGAEVEHQAVAVPASAESGRTPAWRGLIASLFAPRVMRFAVPVLALSLVGVVSYVALRSSNKGAAVQMARDTGRRPGPLGEQPNTSAAPNTDVTNANTAGVAEQNTSATTTGTTASSAPPLAAKGGHGGTVEQPVVADEASEDAPVVPPAPPPAAAATAGGPAESSKAAAKPVAAQTEEAEAARVENKEKSDNRDRPARASEPADEIVSGDVASQQRAPRSRAGEVQMPDGGNQRNQKRGADNNASEDYRIRGGGAAASPKESPRERAGSSPETVSRSRATRRAESRADEDEAVRIGETRAAAGHRFRREGNAWVDVNYRPSMPSTGVRRGTEAFRALVADVPEVGRVAGAIGGEVVVVVGGRAYRIR